MFDFRRATVVLFGMLLSSQTQSIKNRKWLGDLLKIWGPWNLAHPWVCLYGLLSYPCVRIFLPIFERMYLEDGFQCVFRML